MPHYRGKNLKKFMWKKTNFVTDLPKHSPIARYLVGKTSNKMPNLYMHVSVLFQGILIFKNDIAYRI